jgi:UV DNA damage endonuclease
VRLGYACVNTLLPSSARTVRLAKATPARLLELAAANLAALATILRWNRRNGIDVFRVSSGIVPLGGHPANRLVWWTALERELREVGELMSGMQISMHPGQYVVLGAPEERVVGAALADLEYHARLLRAFGLDETHGIVIHAGGVYGDRDAAAERLARAACRLSDDALARLRLENDERWSVADVRPVAEALGVPVVFDAFHHRLAPSIPGASERDLVLRLAPAWRGRQELHFSTQDPAKRPGAHAATLDLDAFARFHAEVGDLDVDCVLEVKDKEQSVLAARDRLYTGTP